ncbi:MAG: molybdopterin molybdenumtransferase MoeA, partial [Chloroflexota bacterium]
MPQLMNADDALEQILAQIPGPAAEQVSIDGASGRVLATDITAPIDLPPFPNSSFYGYAVRIADVQQAGTTLDVVMDIPAGKAPEKTIHVGQAARIMTGAPVPDGADAVIPVEKTNASWSHDGDAALEATVTLHEAVGSGVNIRPVGENIR